MNDTKRIEALAKYATSIWVKGVPPDDRHLILARGTMTSVDELREIIDKYTELASHEANIAKFHVEHGND